MAHLAPHMALLSSGKLICALAIAGNAVNAAPTAFALSNHPAPHSRSSTMIRGNLVFHLASAGKVGIHLASRHSRVDDKQQHGKDLAFVIADAARSTTDEYAPSMFFFLFLFRKASRCMRTNGRPMCISRPVIRAGCPGRLPGPMSRAGWPGRLAGPVAVVRAGCGCPGRQRARGKA